MAAAFSFLVSFPFPLCLQAPVQILFCTCLCSCISEILCCQTTLLLQPTPNKLADALFGKKRSNSRNTQAGRGRGSSSNSQSSSSSSRSGPDSRRTGSKGHVAEQASVSRGQCPLRKFPGAQVHTISSAGICTCSSVSGALRTAFLGLPSCLHSRFVLHAVLSCKMPV